MPPSKTVISLSEAQRRVRTILATVRSLARRTASSAESIEDFEQHLDGRLLAFGRTQTQALVEPPRAFDLGLLIREEMLAVLQKDGGTISVSGPDVAIPQRLAETFCLVIHELLINAIKFGALSPGPGKIAITWNVTKERDERCLDFQWEEQTGGTPLEPPTRRGFGIELLEDVMRYEHDAQPNLEFRPTGVSYSVRIAVAGEEP